jgi:hypothetical protein
MIDAVSQSSNTRRSETAVPQISTVKITERLEPTRTYRGSMRCEELPGRFSVEGSCCKVAVRVEGRHVFDIDSDEKGKEAPHCLGKGQRYGLYAKKLPVSEKIAHDEWSLVSNPEANTLFRGISAVFTGHHQGDTDWWEADTPDGPWYMSGIVSVSDI